MAEGIAGLTGGYGSHYVANIKKHLMEMSFPATKADIIAHSQKGAGPDTPIRLANLQMLPDRLYNSADEVMDEYMKVAGKKAA